MIRGDTPRVSIIIPTFRDRGFLPEALASALRSIEEGDEILIVSNGSPPAYVVSLRGLVRSPIRLIEVPEAGVARARNEGAKQAQSGFLMFLDDDDILGDGAVAHLRRLLAAHPTWNAVAGNIERFGDVERRWDRFLAPVQPVLARDMLAASLTSPGSALLRRSIFQRIGGFDGTRVPTEDWDFWMRVVLDGPIVGTNVLALHYRVHRGNVSRQAARMAAMSHATFRRHQGAVAVIDGAAAIAFAATTLAGWYSPQLRAAARLAITDGEVRVALTSLRWMLVWFITRKWYGLLRRLSARNGPILDESETASTGAP